MPGTFACSAVCFVMPHRLNLECLPCTRCLIACVCTFKFALGFWVLIIRCFPSSMHLRSASCSSVPDHCLGLDGVESWMFPALIIIPPLSMILAGKPLDLPPVRPFTAHRRGCCLRRQRVTPARLPLMPKVALTLSLVQATVSMCSAVQCTCKFTSNSFSSTKGCGNSEFD